MPVQTRRKNGGGSATATPDAKSEQFSVAASPKKGRSRASSPAKKSPANKKAKTSHEDSPPKPAAAATKKAAGKKEAAGPVAMEGVKSEVFEPVVQEINHYGKAIKGKVLKTHVPTVSRKQDPSKLAKRKAITNELRRISIDATAAADAEAELINPSAVKEKAKALSSRKQSTYKQFHKNVMKQIDAMGEKGVKNVLAVKKGRVVKAVAAKKGKSKTVAKKIAVVTKAAAAKEDLKQVQQKTLKELEEIVSPHAAFHPSAVKSKISLKDAKKRVNQEVLKKVSVKHIHRLSEKGVQALLSDKSKKAPGAAPNGIEANGKKKGKK